MDGIAQMARALEDAARRHGHDVAVNRPPASGGVGVTLGMDRNGRVVMLRQPLPDEGGRTTLNHPDVRLVNGRLTMGTLAWIEAWAVSQLVAVDGHRDHPAAAGRSGNAFVAARSHANALALRLVRAAGEDMGAALERAQWRRSQEGFTTSLGDPPFADASTFHRHLGEVRLETVSIAVGAGMVIVTDAKSGRDAEIEIHGAGAIPDTMLASAPGHRLDQLVELPGNAGAAALIREAAFGRDGCLMIQATCDIERFNQGDTQ